MTRFIRYGLPIVALLLFGFALWHVFASREQATPSVKQTRLGNPPVSPFTRSVAGAGIVEPLTENIAVASPLPGVVVAVSVMVGDEVKVGEELFRLDERETQARLNVLNAAAESARAELRRLEQQPRPEEVPIAEAKVTRAEAVLEVSKQNLVRARRLFERGATTSEEIDTRESTGRVAEATLAEARAELALLKAGAWKYEREIAAAAVARAEAEASQAETDLGRLVVRAPVAGEVLQVNVRPGEFAGTPPGEALIVLGNTQQLHVRIDIDEQDIPRFHPGHEAVATLKGQTDVRIPLSFVRVEPYVIPKRSLTGQNTERVDTRVLQVIYRVEEKNVPLYVGQQLDVFIKAD